VALTPRGKALIAGVAAVAVVGGGALVMTGNAGPITTIAAKVGITEPAPDPCPLTGIVPAGDKPVPTRPVLAVKVENTPDAYPLTGLDKADIVYEEVVEGGITRFISVYHCGGAPRVGPVRSARTTDPKILLQYGAHPLLAFSGGSRAVMKTVEEAGVIELTEEDPAAAFTRDESRVIPHNLFTNTQKLWTAAAKSHEDATAPQAVFTYDEETPKPSKRATSATIVFSGLATAEWHWQGGRWVRFLDGAPMTLESGQPIATDNVVIQQVKVAESDLVDVAGYPSPEVTVTGKGKAWVLRDGKLIVGTWERASEGDLTVFRTKQGEEIPLTPGSTFVELAPTGMFDATITFGK
jgi:Protein of unknown function (DUF3048) N-terminal domain/Protein of unknown function (DUF3048) C-terminal domain